MRVYVCGPMSGVPAFNVPAFDTTAQKLRDMGHSVVSPAELDGPETRAVLLASATGSHDDLPPGETWGFYLARDVQLLADDGIEAVVCLPGWEQSRGARLETFVASALLGMEVYTLTNRGHLVTVSTTALVRAWTGNMWDDIVLPVRGAA